MAQAQSMDLRSRLLAAVDSGLSCRAAAARFGVAPSTAIRWEAQRRETGDFAPKPQGGDMRSRRVEERAANILAIWEARRDISLEELRLALTEVGLTVSVAGLHRFFVRRGVTRKKRMARPVCKGILKCSDHSASTYAFSWVTPWPRWTSARLEPQYRRRQRVPFFWPGFPDADRLSGHLHDPSCKHRWPIHADACGRSGYAATG